MKLYKTVYQVTVLSVDVPAEDIGNLREVLYSAQVGDLSAGIEVTEMSDVDHETFVTLCEEQGTDPDFFFCTDCD